MITQSTLLFIFATIGCIRGRRNFNLDFSWFVKGADDKRRDHEQYRVPPEHLDAKPPKRETRDNRC